VKVALYDLNGNATVRDLPRLPETYLVAVRTPVQLFASDQVAPGLDRVKPHKVYRYREDRNGTPFYQMV
jgi:hypothetical protein